MKMFALPIVLAFVVGCTPIQITPIEAPELTNRAEIVIHRESQFVASAVNMIFGANGNDYVKLSGGKYASIYLKPDSYEFFVRSDQADTPYVLNLELAANEVVCLRSFVSSSAAGVAILAGPIGYLVARKYSTFNVEKSECLSDDELDKLKIRTVNYKT